MLQSWVQRTAFMLFSVQLRQTLIFCLQTVLELPCVLKLGQCNQVFAFHCLCTLFTRPIIILTHKAPISSEMIHMSKIQDGKWGSSAEADFYQRKLIKAHRRRESTILKSEMEFSGNWNHLCFLHDNLV